MAINFDFAPLLPEFAFVVDEKCAAFNATDLFTVHIFHFNDIKQLAQGFFFIRDQIKRKRLLAAEVFV